MERASMNLHAFFFLFFFAGGSSNSKVCRKSCQNPHEIREVHVCFGPINSLHRQHTLTHSWSTSTAYIYMKLPSDQSS